MIEELKKNVDTELAIITEISSYMGRLDTANDVETKMLGETIDILISSLKIINNSIPELLSETSLTKELPAEDKKIAPEKEKINLEKINFEQAGSRGEVVISPKDREAFLKNLSIKEDLIKRMRKKKIIKTEATGEFKATRGYLKLSNRFFLKTATDLINKKYYKDLSLDLKKANIDILSQTYIAMILFTTFISIFVGLFLTIFLLFFDITLTFPIISLYNGEYISRLIRIFWIPLALPMFVYLMIYIYPSTEKKSIEKKIDQELPFAVIYMSSISGSGIEPSQIFRIIATSKEYPSLRKEIRKVMNQINLYGYDLVTALNSVGKSTSSGKLAELFAGLSTTINSGGDLSEFFDKRAETLLLEYRLDREKYSKAAETFMDIYISIVIAAPMILMLLIVMISISGINIGFSTGMMNLMIVFVIVLINVVFLTVLHIKQPRY